ncbi:MAG TPA: hypothetical protein VNV85_10590 [Puia sp.]|nr:hypothetical protein [Puia sp.]
MKINLILKLSNNELLTFVTAMLVDRRAILYLLDYLHFAIPDAYAADDIGKAAAEDYGLHLETKL